MKKNETDGLIYYQFESSIFTQCLHGIFTRRGGISPKPWDSLNQGGTVGDIRENVIENRKRVFDVFERPVETIFDVWQVHGTTTICTSEPRELDSLHQKADAIFTDNPRITLFMRFADCVPIMLYDPIKKVVGIIHAGWKGTLNKIVLESVKTIQKTYGSNPGDIIAGIGPSIGPDHFEIGVEVKQLAEDAFGNSAKNLLSYRNHKIFLDLWKANQCLLQESGVSKIEISEICTACNTQDWYSHRAEKGATGRFGALIALKDS